MPGKRLSRAEKKEIRIKRKQLRRDLIEKGIKKRSEFETIARDLGLVYHEKELAALVWLRWFGRWALTKLGIRMLALFGFAALALTFLFSAVTDRAGSFTINLTADMLRAGFVLSDTIAFENPSSRLFSEAIEKVNNITVSDISPNVDEIDGPHNGTHYVAYTFYIKNNGKEQASYRYALRKISATMGVDKAVWIMLFEDGKQVIYAELSADGDPESLYGYRDRPPFSDKAYDYEKQYFEEEGRYGLITTPAVSDDIVVQGLVKDVQPEQSHKYTVVIWIEGNDPECTDDIFGGYAKYSLDFESIPDGDYEGIFKGIFRTEYEDYAEQQKIQPDQQTGE